MNYENLYNELTSRNKTLNDASAAPVKYYKSMVKSIEAGDIKDIKKLILQYEEAVEKLSTLVSSYKEIVNQFDCEEYFNNGDFVSQMLKECEEEGIDVIGEAPVFEMFPYKVKIDAANQELYIDKKKVQCMRPKSFVSTVKKGQERLKKANFNPLSFANELAEAYDLAVLKANKTPGTDIYLNNIYKVMVPMARSRKEYDQQNFAFDIARLITSDLEEIKDGRHFQFGPSRNNGKAIRILDSEGKEEFFATVRFF